MLKIPAAVLEQLRDQAITAFPLECCGILLGPKSLPDANAVTSAVACPNTHPAPRTHYSIAPQLLVAAQRQAREQGSSIVGFYHSHPNRPADASISDQKEALWHGCSYLILSSCPTETLEVRSYRCATQQKLLPEKLDII